MLIMLHDQTGQVHLINPAHVVDIATASTRNDAKTRVLTVNMTLMAKETIGEVYTLCNYTPQTNPAAFLEDDVPEPYGADQLTPAWVQAIEKNLK